MQQLDPVIPEALSPGRNPISGSRPVGTKGLRWMMSGAVNLRAPSSL
jgi:hypothetical protein